MAERGVQTWLGGVSNVVADRHGRLIGFPPNASELLAIPDPDTFCQLPWNKRAARVYCTLFWSKEDPEKPEQYLEADSRGNLRRIEQAFRAKHNGLHMRVGCEPEMFWLKPGDGNEPYKGTTKPYAYHIDQFEQLTEVWTRVYDYATAMGLEMIQADHEDAPGQLELNFRFDRPVTTADNITTYRQICAAVARKHGLLASFMPKPFTGVSANGHHHHFTLIDENGNNVFHDPDGVAELSDKGRHFLGGLLEHFGALMCVGNPTVNSYSRMWDFGYWAPVYRNWGWQNRTCTVRVASGGRFEYRGVDSSCNPYLTIAGLLKAGLDGLKREVDPGPPQEGNTYDLLQEGVELERVPESLGAALNALEADELVREAMPGRLYDVFRHYKRDEWERYLAAVTDWERDEYLEVLP
jgi:glutamine synthetase